jgi:hypothetical protein
MLTRYEFDKKNTKIRLQLCLLVLLIIFGPCRNSFVEPFLSILEVAVYFLERMNETHPLRSK